MEEFTLGEGIPSRTEGYDEADYPSPTWDELIDLFDREDIDEAEIIFVGKIGET